MPDVLAAELLGGRTRPHRDRAVIVDDPNEGAVIVRWRLGRPDPWRCQVCGPRGSADCPHTFAAALLLAEVVLGLTRAPGNETTHPKGNEL